jgi:mono/diheme cytochrome c family protein
MQPTFPALRHAVRQPSWAAFAALTLATLLVPALAQAESAGETAFTSTVWPALKTSCISCHGPTKQKHHLRLDTRAGWMKGSEDGKIVVEGDPDASEVIKAISYQEEDTSTNMPPPGKKHRLTPEQVDAFRTWIKAGLPWPNPSPTP